MLATILFLASVRLLSPMEGATVELQKPEQRAFFALPREERLAADAYQGWRDRQVACGWRPLPVRFAWAGATKGAHLNVRRLPDGQVFFTGLVCTNKIELSNFEIAREHVWEVASDGQSATGRFRTAEAAPRFLNVGRVIDTRDFGGWPGKDGRCVRQGVILRSGQFNSTAVCRAYSLESCSNSIRLAGSNRLFPRKRQRCEMPFAGRWDCLRTGRRDLFVMPRDISLTRGRIPLRRLTWTPLRGISTAYK